MSSKRTFTHQLSNSLDTRRDAESDVQPRIYLRPVGRSGFHVVRRECNEEEVIVSGSRTFAPGTQVQTGRFSGRPGEAIITEPPPGRRGASAFPITPVRREIDALGITSALPSTVPAGSTTTVRLSGFGFRESPIDAFRAVRFNPTLAEWASDPLAVVDSTTWISSTEVDIELTVDASAADGYFISIEVERG